VLLLNSELGKSALCFNQGFGAIEIISSIKFLVVFEAHVNTSFCAGYSPVSSDHATASANPAP
jgi:hypothetical protein